MNTIGIKARQIRELTEGYKATRIEDKELADEWDTTSGMELNEQTNTESEGRIKKEHE